MVNEIKFKSDMKNLRFAENLVDEISGQYELSSEVYGNVLVSLVEAVSNAIQHGNKSNVECDVTIQYALAESMLQLDVIDEGVGFDFDNVPDPTAPENIEKPYGRGIFLIRNLSDEMSFLNGGSQIQIKFKLQ